MYLKMAARSSAVNLMAAFSRSRVLTGLRLHLIRRAFKLNELYSVSCRGIKRPITYEILPIVRARLDDDRSAQHDAVSSIRSVCWKHSASALSCLR